MAEQTARPALRPVSALYIGHACGQLGAGLLFLAIPLVALDLARSPTLLAGAGAAYAAAGIALSPVAGTVADGISRRALLVGTSFGRAVLAAALPLVLVLGQQPGGVALLILESFLLGAAGAFYLSAVHSVLPSLVSARELQPANAVVFVLTNGAILIGPAIAGGLVGTIGITGTLDLSAAVFLPSAAAFTALQLPATAGAPASVGRSLLRRTWRGVAFSLHNTVLRSLLLLWFLIMLGAGSLFELLIYRLNAELRTSVGTVGLVVAGAASGGLLGPAILWTLAKRHGAISRARHGGRGPVLIAAPLLGCLYLSMAALGSPLPLALLGGAGQAAIAVAVVRSITLAQQVTEPALLGRVTSIALIVEQTAVMLGLALMGWLTSLHGALFAFGVLGLELLVLGGGAAAIIAWRAGAATVSLAAPDAGT